MSKKFILTEDEKNQIKGLYNINEQDDDDFLIKAFELFGQPTNDDTTSTSGDYSSLSKITDKGNELLNNPEFKNKLSELSKKIGVDKDCIIKVMNHESKLDPTVVNSIGCVGLVQFCPDSKGGNTKTINGKQYSLSELRNNLSLQMEAIENFWLDGKKQGKIRQCSDLQIYNFFPLAAGKPDDFVLQTKSLSARTIAKSNPIFNRVLGRERDTPLTVGDIKQYQQKTGMA